MNDNELTNLGGFLSCCSKEITVKEDLGGCLNHNVKDDMNVVKFIR